MFIVFDPQGLTKPYVEGIRPKVSGAISQVTPVSEIHSVTSQGVSPDRNKKNPYKKLDEPTAPHKLIYASDIMTSPVETQTADFPISEALKLFKSKRFRHLPIINKDSKLVGILSDRDLFYLHLTDPKHHHKLVKEIMATPVLSAAPQTEIREIAKVMFNEHIGALPIVDEKHVIVGIITRSDILRGLLKHGSIEMWG